MNSRFILFGLYAKPQRSALPVRVAPGHSLHCAVQSPTGASALDHLCRPVPEWRCGARVHVPLRAQVALASAVKAEPLSGQRKVFTFASAHFVRAIKTR
jgi:hypothetical protein